MRRWALLLVMAACSAEDGHVAYTRACAPCHGERGDGNGPAAVGLRPPPRDFTAPRFKMKFAFVDGGKLPRDEDLAHVVRWGLAGTAMRAWDVSDEELAGIIKYIKTFSPRWGREQPGEAKAPGTDPWPSAAEAAAEGKRLYHVEAGCASCHPSYATADELRGWTGRDEVRPDSRLPVGLRATDYGAKILPPDFTRQPLRAVHDDPADPGHALRDLWRAVVLGVPGTAMPSFPADERKVWALVHYVDGLRRGVVVEHQIDDHPGH